MNDNYTTLRIALTECNFDWEKGTITIQTKDEKHQTYPAKAFNEEGELKDLIDKTVYISYGLPEFPPFIAHDPEFIYLHVVYDGAEWVEAVARDPSYYDSEDELPEFGGG